MIISIYQVNMERDPNNVCFMSHDRLEKLQGSPEIDCAVYDRAYSGDVDCRSLEGVYTMFNVNHPVDFFSRSLSVSDVIEVVDPGDAKDVSVGFYFCDSFGFKMVDFNPEKTQDKPGPERISVLVVEPGKIPKEVLMPNELRAIQKIVGGHFEVIHPFSDNVVIACNEEGKINGLPHNRTLFDDKGQRMDALHGTFFVVGVGKDDFCSLTKKQTERYLSLFETPETIYLVNRRRCAFKDDSNRLVSTNMGDMPINDYRDIAASQHGFNNYKDMYEQGFRLGNDLDIIPVSPKQASLDEVIQTCDSMHNKNFKDTQPVPNQDRDI